MTVKKDHSFVYCATFAALVAIGFVLKTDPVIAQQVDEEIEEVVVIEAPIVRRHAERTAASGMRTEIIELRRRVSYADLDLSKHADVIELEKRIETTAKEACEKLDEMFPIPPSDIADIRRCTRKAIEGTEEEVQAAIAAAK